ncbi:MAG: CPBP family intramembrane metalloprotease [Oscillospiraceae bacterium]|nr:CPBP family intramembrane metalloprotease [Oscillospiraceae bacterium]
MNHTVCAGQVPRRAGHGPFYWVGWALLFHLLSSMAVQMVGIAIANSLSPENAYHPVYLWFLSVISVYGVGFWLFCITIRRTPLPIQRQAVHPMGVGQTFRAFILVLGTMYLANLITVGIIALIGYLRGAPIENPVEGITEYPAALRLILACVIAPLVEETMFRKHILRRLRPYGDAFAMLISALAFALFHGNPSQLLYTFVVGLVFGYIALRTGGIHITILLHAAVNLVGTWLVPAFSEFGDYAAFGLALLMIIVVIWGIIYLIAACRNLRFAPTERPLPNGGRYRLFFATPGVICFLTISILIIATYFIV